MEFLIPLLFAVILMWVLIVLPQRRRAGAHRKMMAGLRVGDEIMTAGGFYGTVTRIAEEEVRVELAPGFEVRLARGAVASVQREQEREDIEQPGEDARG